MEHFYVVLPSLIGGDVPRGTVDGLRGLSDIDLPYVNFFDSVPRGTLDDPRKIIVSKAVRVNFLNTVPRGTCREGLA